MDRSCRLAPAENDFSLDKMRRNVVETWNSWWERSDGDPNIEDLQRALGPAPPDGYISIIIAVEDVLLKREWDVSAG